jgi:hypothetical protein
LAAGCAPLAALALASAGCGSGSAPEAPTIAPAKTFRLAQFQPSGSIEPGRAVEMSFKILQPSGATLARYRRGPGPHTGIHLIIVRDDLATIIHRHPKVRPDGVLKQKLVISAPGHYRVVVDTYPNVAGAPRNFQLFASVRVGKTAAKRALPPHRPTVTVDGYTFTIEGNPTIRAIQPEFLTIKIADSRGRPPKLVPFYGALAHAIFFRAGSLDYFHTHVCAPNAAGCASFSSAPTGTSTTPGILHVGVLLPLAGTWRLFLQAEIADRVVTAPFTFQVR